MYLPYTLAREAALSSRRRWSGGGICQTSPPPAPLNGTCSTAGTICFYRSGWQQNNGVPLETEQSPSPRGVTLLTHPVGHPITHLRRCRLSQAGWRLAFPASLRVEYSRVGGRRSPPLPHLYNVGPPVGHMGQQALLVDHSNVLKPGTVLGPPAKGVSCW